jgi:NADH:ubiquinone oxidoreductase subunit E
MKKDTKKKGSVLVVGAGIAGMQASLDLADSGFKVYLAEKNPSIGGVMSQLDKTFPTNDCAMCIMSPKLVSTGRHPNIELITNSEIEGLSGKAGNFTVDIKKRPRYVDETKCTGCGVCTENCPVKKELYLEPPEKVEIALDPEDLERMTKILKEYKKKESPLIPVLQGINANYNYLPENILRYISEELDVPLSLIYRIATFYNAFSLTPRGKNIITICLGTACHVKGAPRIISALQKELGIGIGENTEDMMFTLETVRCLGCCGLAPVMTVGEDIHGKMTQAKVPEIVAQHREESDAKTEA